jgi:hypothetical protein
VPLKLRLPLIECPLSDEVLVDVLKLLYQDKFLRISRRRSKHEPS